MSTVLVTGATGQLGRSLVGVLAKRGHEVRAMSRRPGADLIVAELTTGAGLADAVRGADAVIHAATGWRERAYAVDVTGTRRLVDACEEAGVRHLIYTSIVGVDRNPHAYYAAKLEAERTVARSGLPYSIVRGAQFHTLVAYLLTMARRGPVCPIPAGWVFQPVDVDEFACHLADRLGAGPSGEIGEYVGPERLSTRALARSWLAAQHAHAAVVPVPVPGRVGRAFRMRSNIGSPGVPHGRVTWAEWLSQNVGG